MFRLAAHLKKPISEIEAMSARDLAEWQAYWRIEPFGGLTGYEQAGIVAAQVTNMAGKSLKKGKTMKVSDFIPYIVKKKESLSSRLKAAFRRHQK